MPITEAQARATHHASNDCQSDGRIKGSLKMNTTRIRELTDADLDLVSGERRTRGRCKPVRI